MAIVNGYVTLGELKNELGIMDDIDDPRLEMAIEAASRQIDAHCGRRFYTDAGAERKFHAMTTTLCPVDDIATTVGLTVEIDTDADGTYATELTIDTDFLLEPLNAAPYDTIELVDNYYFPLGRRPGVKVTADFGYGSTPTGVKAACIAQAKNISKATGSGVFGSMQLSVDGYPMRIPGLDSVTIAQLAQYRKVSV